MSETKEERSERLKRETAERMNQEYREGTFWEKRKSQKPKNSKRKK